MITKIATKRFRSIEDQEIDLAPITVFYGRTASGKSSLLYSLLVLKNFLANPNRQADAFFNLGFMDLGGFDQCCFDHEASKAITIRVCTSSTRNITHSYSISLSKSSADLELTAPNLRMTGRVSVPYPINQAFPFELTEDGVQYQISWNGIVCTVTPKTPTAELQQLAQEKTRQVNDVPETLKRIDVAPHRRGFFKPNYTTGPAAPIATSEDEVASLIINDMNLAPRISAVTEEVFGRDFRLHNPPGTATVFFQTTHKKQRLPGLLVNDGFGVNQVVYILAKVFRQDMDTLLIEEPEVHLHPTIVRSLARQLCTIAKEDSKQFLMTTHSEQFVLSLLVAISEGLISHEDVRFYLAEKEKKRTVFHEQKITPDGQVEGGLLSFMEAEMEDVRKFIARDRQGTHGQPGSQ